MCGIAVSQLNGLIFNFFLYQITWVLKNLIVVEEIKNNLQIDRV
jgi:hypothetical protein